MSELKPQSWDELAKVADLGASAELLAKIVAAAPGAVEDVSREIKSRFLKSVRHL